jgi:Ca2+-binding EF-hand superfamily protein
MHADFNLFDSFKIFDDMGRGSLTLPELYNGLVNKLGIVPTQDEIDLFFHRYDKDRDGRLRFTEFCEAFVPQEVHYAHMINSRHSMNRSSVFAGVMAEHLFVPITVMDLKEVWRTHFRVEMLAEDLRQKLSMNPLFNLENAFEVCDTNNSGEVTHHEIRRLVESRGLFVSDKEARSVMDKFDKGRRGTINKQEFL